MPEIPYLDDASVLASTAIEWEFTKQSAVGVVFSSVQPRPETGGKAVFMDILIGVTRAVEPSAVEVLAGVILQPWRDAGYMFNVTIRRGRPGGA